MLRLVLIVVCAIAGAVALYKLYHYFKTRQWDWTGLAFAIAFVVLAIWLRNATGTGGVID
jgi:undecaprenyl pyrophosphate phosphatase UppP